MKDHYEEIQNNKEQIKKLFLSRVKKGFRCWMWKGSVTNEDQGQIGLSFATIKAHRLSYMLYIGHLKPRQVLEQTCGNKLCVNPKHQKIIINKKILHRLAGPRDVLGQNNGRAKLRDKDIKKIRKLAAKKSYSEIAKKYDMSATQIAKIARMESWTHVPD
ncbi:MAG: hypothetical protein KDK41_13125 [Leptospiraceae bacterium]|nr:hypothetical protein [Leptospiraceae bacterium]MCB1201581.1 hypothetical protein [Leptospiraceae bacterium]